MSRFTTRGAALAVIAMLSAVIASVAFAGASGVQELQPLEPASSAEDGRMTNETAKYWFVEFSTAPLADGSAAAEVSADAAEFRSEAKAEGAKYSERMRFQTLWNGMSIEASTAAISTIEGLSSVEAVYPVGTYPIPSTPTVSPDLATAIQMTGASIAQNTLGLTGKGIKVAVMDTGIDYHHPDLGGGFGKNKRVFKGFDFVGDAYIGSNTPVPDPNPDDCNGHGTHVAGIVGANGFVKGVAPDVRFGAYRVFGCTGFTTDEVMIAAMERALKDDMDVLNMSIGDAFNNWPGTPTAAASDRLVRKGMVVVASIGNSGANGLYAAGAPGVGEKVIGVASYDNQLLSLRTFTASPDNRVIGYGQASASPLAPVTGSDELARTGTQTSTADACLPLPAGSLTGKYALIRRGTCGFYVKSLNAMNAGAKGVVIYNNLPPFQGFITVDPGVGGFPGGTPITIPVVNISGVDGNELDTRLAGGGPVTISWTGNFTQLPVATPGLISSFSSYGLAADLSLKPDIGAPGGLILSTIPLELGAHGSNSGTSMSSPHVAGASALLLESMKGKDDDDDDDDDGRDRAELVRDILQNSADPALWSGNPTLGFLDQVHRQGAGMLDIDDAIKAKTLVTPGKLSLGEGSTAITKRLRVRNDSKSTVTYAITHAPALATGPNTFTVAAIDAPSTVTFSTASLTVSKRSTRSLNVTITPNAGLADRSLYGGYIVLTPSDGTPPLRVPYAGFKGDYQSIPILTTGGANNFPRLGRTTNGTTFSFVPPASNVFDLVGIAGQPNALYHMDHQARRVTLWILKADGTVLGRGPELEYHPRNSTSTGFFALAWDGTYRTGNKWKKQVTAADGEYRFTITAEKPLAEKNNPAHVESVTLPGSFVIDRP